MAYLAAVLLAGSASIAAAIAYQDEVLFVAIGQVALAVLTYPLGFLASAAGGYWIFTGTITPLEALVVEMPLYMLLGYLQWYRLLPALYRRRD